MVVFKPSLYKINSTAPEIIGKTAQYISGRQSPGWSTAETRENDKSGIESFLTKDSRQDNTDSCCTFINVSWVLQLNLFCCCFLFSIMCLGVDSNRIHPCSRPLNLWSCSASGNTNAVPSTRLYRTRTHSFTGGSSTLMSSFPPASSLRQWPLGGVRGQHHYHTFRWSFYICVFFFLITLLPDNSDLPDALQDNTHRLIL